MKKALVVVLFLIAILVGLVAAVLFSLGAILKAGVEKGAPMVMGVNAEVAKAKLSPFSGEGRVEGLVIHNPEGFKSPSAVKADKIELSLEPKSLFSDKVHIRSLKLVGPEITLEGNPKNNNLTVILKRLESLSESGEDSEESEESPGKKLQIDDLLIAGARLNVILKPLGDQLISVELPDIRLRELGAGPEGVAAAGVIRDILKSILKNSDAAFGGVAGQTAHSEALKTVGQKTLSKGAEQAAGKILEGAQKTLGGAAGALLGGKKESGK